MDNNLIRDIKQEKVKISEDKTLNQYQIEFNSVENNKKAQKTIVLSGEGSLNILTPV